MQVIHLQLDEATVQRAQQVAAARQWTMEELFTAALAHLEEPSPPEGEIWGLFADEPELVDALLEDVMATRERSSG